MNIDTKIDCVKREIRRRKKIFPALVDANKVNQGWADIELATMQSVLETLTQLKGVLDA